MMRAVTAVETNNGSFFCPISALAPGKLHNISFTQMKLLLMNAPRMFIMSPKTHNKNPVCHEVFEKLVAALKPLR